MTPAACWFPYTPDRKGIHPQTNLAKLKACCKRMSMPGYNALFEDGTVLEAACWAPAPRKFSDPHAARPTTLTTDALRRIAELYDQSGNPRPATR